MPDMAYIRSPPGMFKCIAVGIGFLAMAFVAAAYDNAAYYQTVTFQTREGSFTSDITGADECSKGSKGENDQTPDEQRLKCPSIWLSAPAVFIIGITWAVTLVLLIIMVVVNHQGLVKLDGIIHMVCGIILLVSALGIAGFVIMVFMSNYPCSGKEGNRPGPGPGPYRRSGTTRPKERSVTYPKEEFKNCSELSAWMYRVVLHIIGLILTIAAGVMYIVAGMMAKRAAAIGPGGPMWAGQGAQPSMYQSQAQQSQYPPQQQQSVQGTPSSQQQQQA